MNKKSFQTRGILMSDVIKTASHPFAKQNPLFRHAYCKGLILSILANKALPKAARMERCAKVIGQIAGSLAIQPKEGLDSYLQNIATTDIDQILSNLRNTLNDKVSPIAFLYEVAFFQAASFRTDAAFQDVWKSFAGDLKLPANEITAIWNACQTLANCQFPPLDISLLSWLCGTCGISWTDVAALFTGESDLKENMTIMLAGGVPLELAWCPAGVFQMGSPANEAEREEIKSVAHSKEIEDIIAKNNDIVVNNIHAKGIPTMIYNGKKHTGAYKED